MTLVTPFIQGETLAYQRDGLTHIADRNASLVCLAANGHCIRLYQRLWGVHCSP